MNRFKCGALVALVSMVSWSSNAAVEKPIVMDEAMLSITVSDFHGFIDEVGAVAAQVSPMMNGAMLKSMIGMQLGDPSLAGIVPGSGLSIVALDPTNIFAVVEVAEAQSAAYVSALQTKGIQAAYESGALMLASSAEILTNNIAMVSAVKTALLTQRSPTLRVAMQPSTMIARNQEAIDGFLAMLPGLMGQSMMQQPGATLETTEGLTKMLEAELRILLSISDQCEVAEIVFAPKGGSLMLSETFAPRAGTPLADLVNAPPIAKMDPKIHAGLLGDGTVLCDFQYANSEALGTFVGFESEKLIKVMNLDDVDAGGVVETMKKWISVYGGSGCEAVTFAADGSFNVRYVMGVQDEAKALEILKTMNLDMAPFLKLYESLGAPMTVEFKENVSEADGVKIHQFAVKMDVSTMPAEQREQMEAMGIDHMVYDVAITDGKMFYSDPGQIPALIKTVNEGGGTPLKARSVYPADGFYYLDLDMGEYMAFAASTMPDTPETAMMKQQMGVMFQGVAPVTSAGFKQDGLVNWSINIPGELLAKYGQMLMMAQMQQMQQQQQMGAPQGAPQGVPVQ